jgi:peptidoglycan/xylan/chitin deacetylase (PgdA/CDA1 family)
MYHRIADEPFDPWGISVSPERFEAHMRWLAEHRTVLDVSELARLHQAGSLPSDAAAITFDDGYASVAQIAAPVIEQLGLKATVFVPLGLIDRQQEFWWDELQQLIMAFRGESLIFDDEALHLGPAESDDAEWPPGAPPRTCRQHAMHRIWSEIRTKPHSEIEATLAALRDQAGGPAKPRESHRLMTSKELKTIASDRFKIGSHAMTHPSLTALPASEGLAEIRLSVAAAEAVTGQRPSAFAYPYGEYDPDLEATVQACGFECACTVDRGPVSPGSRPFALPRLGIGNWPLDLFKRVLLEL